MDPATLPHTPLPPAQAPLIRARAAELETAFLAEMLRHAGMSPQKGAFSGGIGEEQFASFLREGQAAAMVRAGGIGLAERLIRSWAEEGK
jgi:Rod binding domain-containing protein